ncbi:hypothetical protein Btru_053880 [Bulinus truncatus]|nr:hypothetical protein Btru_053880 [Bulinus truncatus]
MAFIRTKERKVFLEAINGEDRTIVQVFGPPMVGKSELIQQMLKEKHESNRANSEQTICYYFCCKNIYRLQELFSEMIRVLDSNQCNSFSEEQDQLYDKEQILRRIKRIVHRRCCRHVFVFHKCESFSEQGKRQQFLCFLGEILNVFHSGDFKVNLVLSTYKKFHLVGIKTRLVRVGMLIDPWDILSLLHQYAPWNDVIAYVDICQRYLCLPDPIVQLAVRYVSKNVSPHDLPENYLSNESEFYHHLLEQRVQEVYTWLAANEVELIRMITRTGINPFCIEIVHNMIKKEHLEHGLSTYQKLVDEMVIEEIGQSGYCIVHPLALYKCAAYPHGPRDLQSQTNSYTRFIGHVMTKAELNREKHAVKGLTYGCHLSEWHGIKGLCQTAIQTGQLNDILKVAVVARRLIMVVEPNECKQFYTGLFKTAQLQGSSRELAVIEACLGHSLASGADINFKESMKHLESALETLKERGPTFFYKWALRRKAIILFRMCDYPKSIKYFQRADHAQEDTPMSPGDHQTLSVTPLQEEEEKIIGEIYETIPVIFTGDYKSALEKCFSLNETINERYEHHPDHKVLLNNIGLAIHRGTNDLKGALFWYLKSLKLRSHLVKICPQSLLVTLNHVAEIKALTGDLIGAENDLQKAISIIRESYWYHQNTAQILTSMADVNMKLNKFQEAFEFATEAEEILRKVNKHHDLRLQVNLGLVHYTLLLHRWSASPHRTIEDYIDVIHELGLSIQCQMSYHGHHYLMSSYEHGMVCNWGVCEDRLKTYRRLLVEFVEGNSAVQKCVERGDNATLLGGHKGFLEYVKNTEVEDMELGTLLENLNESCPMCRAINEILHTGMWMTDRLKPLRDVSESLFGSRHGSLTLYDCAAYNENLVMDYLAEQQLTGTLRQFTHLGHSVFNPYTSVADSSTSRKIPNNELSIGTEILDDVGGGKDSSPSSISRFDSWSDVIATGRTDVLATKLNTSSSCFSSLSSSDRNQSVSSQRHISASSERHLSPEFDDKGTVSSITSSSEEYIWVSSPEN